MSRCIDADALKKSVDECDICNVCPERKVRCSYDCEFPDHLSPKFEALIDAQPTIEPKHGEWKFVGSSIEMMWACPFCGERTFGFEEHLPNYCSNCGADLRKGVNV